MFDKLFKKDKKTNMSISEETVPEDSRKVAFELLIFTYLEKHGIDQEGNKSSTLKQNNNEELAKQTREFLGFVDNIEEVIISDWIEKRKSNNSLTPKEFVNIFILEFHNIKIENVAPNFVKERNIKLQEAYRQIVHTIERLQGYLENEELRTIIESDFRQKAATQLTMFQCTTLFCIVSLGCDQLGRYNIVYSVDYRFQNMISQDFANTFIRRIYEFTSGEMEPFVRIGSLCADCIEDFKKIIVESKSEPYHTIKINSKHSNNL